MKVLNVCFVLLLFSAASQAQTAPAAPPPPQQPSTAQQSPMHPHDMQAMHEHNMQEMKAQLQKMRATLDQMKANAAKIKDPAARQDADSNVTLWETMVQHMESMVAMMSDHPMPMMGGGLNHGGMQGGMSCGCMKQGQQQGKPGSCCGRMKAGAGCCSGGKCMRPKAPPAPAGAPSI